MDEIKRTHIHQIEQQGPILPEGVVITTSTNSGDEYTLVSAHEHAPDSITIRCPPECGESLRTRVDELEVENTRLKAELACEKCDHETERRAGDAMARELAVRDRAFEKLAIEATREIAQARVELAKETTLARVDEIEEAYHSADNSKLVFKEAKS